MVWQNPPRKYTGYYGIWSTSGWYASYWNAFLLPSATKLQQGNVFTDVCHTLCSHWGTQCMLGYTSPWADTPPGRHPSMQTSPWADTPLGRHPQGRHPLPSECWDTHPQADIPLKSTCWDTCPHPVGQCSGRYTSYWNAFLLLSAGKL